MPEQNQYLDDDPYDRSVSPEIQRQMDEIDQMVQSFQNQVDAHNRRFNQKTSLFEDIKHTPMLGVVYGLTGLAILMGLVWACAPMFQYLG